MIPKPARAKPAKGRRHASAAPPASTRTRKDAHERRSAILAAAHPLFLERPYDDVSIEEIAQRAELSKGLVFFYFGSKRGLFVELARQAAQELVESTWIPEGPPPVERLRLALVAYVRYVRKNEIAYKWLMSQGVATQPELSRLVSETRDTLAHRLVEGEKRASPIGVRGFIGFVEASMLEQLREKRRDDDALIELWVRVLAAVLSLG